MAVDREPFGVAKQRFWPYAIPEPPSGHCIGLAPSVQQDQAVTDRRIPQKARMRGAVIKDFAIDFVAENCNLRVSFEGGDEPVEFVARHDAAGWVSGTVDNDQPRARSDLVQHFVGAEREVCGLRQRDRDRGGARKPNYTFIDREAWVRIEDLSARFAKYHDREEHGDLAAGNDQDTIRRHLDCMSTQEVGGDGG